MRRLWFGVVLDGTLYQACVTEGRALRQLLYTILFMWLVQATMESSSSGSRLSASAAFIQEHMSLHGAGLSVKVRTAVIRVLGAIKPEDEDDLGLIGEADFELILKSGLGAFCILPAIASHRDLALTLPQHDRLLSFVVATAMEIVHFRRHIKSCLVPEVCMSTTSFAACSPHPVGHSAGALVTSTEKKAGLKSPSPVSIQPRPCNSMSPVAGDVPPPRGGVANWLLVDTLNLTKTLVDDHDFYAKRTHANSYEFCQHEWAAVECEVLKLLRERSVHDCFWLLQERTAVPVNNPKKKPTGGQSQWNQAWCPFPPYFCTKGSNKFAETGYEYKCDHRLQTGCPCKLKIIRVWNKTGDHYTVWVNDVHARHGCNHTLTTNGLDGNMGTSTTPSLHAVLKTFIQRFLFDASRALPWSAMKEKAESYVFRRTYLHCTKGHMAPNLLLSHGEHQKKYLAQPTCKHMHILNSFLDSMSPDDCRAFIVRSGVPVRETWSLGSQRREPYHKNLERASCDIGDVLYYRFVDRYHSIATQLLDGGLNKMHPGNFSVLVNKQAERYGCSLLQACMTTYLLMMYLFVACMQICATVEPHSL